MEALTDAQRDKLAEMLRERKQTIREEIRAGLSRMQGEGYEDLLSGTSDAGDEGLASLVTDLTNAEVARDAAEMQDILAAQARLASDRYGTCVDCEEPIPYARLAAYPTAKRCIRCQEIYETAHGAPGAR